MVYKHHTNLKDMLLADLHLKVMHGMFCSVTKPKKCNCRDNSKVNGQYMFGGEYQTGNLIYNTIVLVDGKHYLGKTLEHVAQAPLVVAGTYNMHNSMSCGSNRNLHARARDRNSESANLNDKFS